MLTLDPLLGKFGLKKSKLFVLPENWHTRTCTHNISKMLILISILVFLSFKPKSWGCWFLFGRLVFWNSKPKSIFWLNLSKKTWILHCAWKLIHRVSSGCDWKNTEQGLEEKIKMINCIKCLLLLYLKTESINKRMLDKWDYYCNQNFSYQKSFASTKILKQDQDYL